MRRGFILFILLLLLNSNPGTVLDTFGEVEELFLNPITQITAGSSMVNSFEYNGYLYVADGPEGLRVVNLDNIYEPSTVAKLKLGGEAKAFKIIGNYLYAAVDGAKLAIVDISNPILPLIVGVIPSGNALDIVVEGSFAYIAIFVGIEIIDISDVRNPIMISVLTFSGLTRDLVVKDQIIYVGSDIGETRIIDATDPYNPLILSSVTLSYVRDLFLSGDILYVQTNTYFRWFNISSNQFVELGSLINDGTSVIDNSNYIYLTNMTHLNTFIKSNDTLEYQNSIETQNTCWEIQLFNNNIFCAQQDHGFSIYAVLGANLFFVSSLNPPTDLYENFIKKPDSEYLFVQNQEFGLVIFSLLDPHTPIRVSELELGNVGYGMALVDRNGSSYLLMANRMRGLEIVDISNPLMPNLVKTISFDIDWVDISMVGNLLIANSFRDVYIFDVSDLFNPQLKSTFNFGSTIMDVEPYNNLIMVGTSLNLNILNITSWTLELIGTYSNSDGFYKLYPHQNVIYALRGYGFCLIDYSNITNIIEKSCLFQNTDEPVGGDGDIIRNQNDELFYISTSGYFSIVNYTDSNQPFLVKGFSVGNGPSPQLHIEDNLIYINERAQGVSLYNLTTQPPTMPVTSSTTFSSTTSSSTSKTNVPPTSTPATSSTNLVTSSATSLTHSNTTSEETTNKGPPSINIPVSVPITAIFSVFITGILYRRLRKSKV